MSDDTYITHEYCGIYIICKIQYDITIQEVNWVLERVSSGCTNISVYYYSNNLNVISHVLLQVPRLCEILLTLLTSIRLLPSVCPGMCLQVTRCSETLFT